jgi:ATP-dependent protease HslVU ATPase subunit
MEQIDDFLTPEEIVRELDKYIIGQEDAKKSVAIALRNRMRRRMLPQEIAEEITPKNIIMIGPTGVGKTEIARRIAKLTGAPFMKVEATKFTEVGYVGRDVESIIRDLAELSLRMVKSEKISAQEGKTRWVVEERLLDLLFNKRITPEDFDEPSPSGTSTRVDVVWPTPSSSAERTREKIREKLHQGELEDREIEIEIEESSMPVEVVNVGEITQEQGWFKEFTQKFNQQPCPELQINYSTKCENCHKSIHEAQLEVQNIENTILNFKMALQSFFQELPEPDLKITPQSKPLALPSKLTLRDLKKRINDIQLPPETVITITLEELK